MSEHNIPRYAMWRGQRVMVLYYNNRNTFMVLDKTDTKRLVSRDQLTFVRGHR